ncbi:MAG TPA: AAA family ATPase, partial [Chitinophagales bacterium]|nr:AAA family ATPase [Chitinophagales bacterium]
MSAFANDVEGIQNLSASYQELRKEIGKVIIGQDNVVKYVLLSIFCDSHSLLVGVPGLAKTLLVRTVADALELNFKRIQFTPDLMPSDIIGAEVLNEDRHFHFNRGPIFANIVLADEINRTPPKTQSALLEAMQERQVTAAGQAHALELPFFVLATQNPIEQEGTYPLPEAQLDRFMFNVVLDYPQYEEELQVVKSTTTDNAINVRKIIGAKEIIAYQHLIRRMPVADNVVEYAVKLVSSTRPNTAKAAKIVNEF